MPVGSFSSESRTLYVGGLPGGRFATKLKERLAEHFGEWGELENINYIPRINAAFSPIQHDLVRHFHRTC